MSAEKRSAWCVGCQAFTESTFVPGSRHGWYCHDDRHSTPYPSGSPAEHLGESSPNTGPKEQR